jgi:hypothetical protein
MPLGSEDDLRLVLESFKDSGAATDGAFAVGVAPLPTREATDALYDIFRHGALLVDADIAAYRTEGVGTELTVTFDLDHLAGHFRTVVAKGVGRDRQLVELLSGMPIEVTDRIDAAKANPRLAGHLLATAADHLVWRLRLRIQETLVPMSEHRSTLVWRGPLDTSDASAASVIAPLLSFATSIRLDLPAAETSNA